MPGGLVALFDDVAVIARAAAASIDDVALAAGKASTKAAGVVIDDAAVTPSYVTGFTPDRELPIIGKIARGSLFNKLLVLLPVALLLSAFLPWAITPLLMIGGAYLCYEGAEKFFEWFGGEHHGETLEDDITDMAAFEKARVSGAIRTDMILSAEIMAITLAAVADESFATRAGVLALVGIGITVAIYGLVALIVKMDDIGLHLAKRPSAGVQRLGRGLVAAMPKVMSLLSTVGTLAMLWVGGGIVLHGMEELGVAGPAHIAAGFGHWLADLAPQSFAAILDWLGHAGAALLFGLVLGGVIIFFLHRVFRINHADH